MVSCLRTDLRGARHSCRGQLQPMQPPSPVLRERSAPPATRRTELSTAAAIDGTRAQLSKTALSSSHCMVHSKFHLLASPPSPLTLDCCAHH
eukprot:6190523-Pleurochrysis_carterae.AAC.1